jgi:Family of unknown function (DUF5681)
MTPEQDDDDVGYGRPPKRTRWKHGQSGNPRRQHPARSKSTVEMIDKFFLKPVEVTVDGETKVISTLEAIVMQLWLKEVSGDQRALKVRLKYQEFAKQNSEPKLEVIFVDDDYTGALASVPATEGTEP